jgi:hypothetical protein
MQPGFQPVHENSVECRDMNYFTEVKVEVSWELIVTVDFYLEKCELLFEFTK